MDNLLLNAAIEATNIRESRCGCVYAFGVAVEAARRAKSQNTVEAQCNAMIEVIEEFELVDGRLKSWAATDEEIPSVRYRG